MDDESELNEEMVLIERFAGDDDRAARAALDVLARKIRHELNRSMYRMIPIEADREDVIETVLRRLWQHRKTFEARSIPAWWKFVGVTARRCAADHRRGAITLPLTTDPEDERQKVHEEIWERLERERLYGIADEHWLGIAKGLSRRDRDRRLLAAQLYFLHGCSIRQVTTRVGDVAPEPEEVTKWVHERSNIFRLAYSQCYLSNDELTRAILSTEENLDHLTKRTTLGHGEPPEGWTLDETRIVIFRFRVGLPPDKIAQKEGKTPEEVERIVDRCRLNFPFTQKAERLLKGLDARGVKHNPLKERTLWKRIVFQYYVADELPHKQIHERAEPPARLADFMLTLGMLNVWIGNRRLQDELGDYATRCGDGS